MSSRHFNCPSCSKEISVDSAACPSCGTLLDDGATQRFDARKSPTQSPTRSYDSIDNARFVPGAILLQRYRIVGLLGKGGMGEVYRADDLKLGQAVALKFLPDHLLSDGAALARFHREVRVARQVSHKNVCRVYDIGETGGRAFLSMEYIKGEELSSLLRRIGSLPIDKSIRDPLVGRDLLIGTVIGASLIVVSSLSRIAPNWIGKATPVTLTPGYGHTRYTSVLQSLSFPAFSRAFPLLHLRLSVAGVYHCIAE